MSALRRLAACLSAALPVFCLCAAVPVSADTQETFSDSDLTFEFVEGGVRIVDAAEGLVTINIPNKVGEYPVLSIGEYAFSDCLSLRSVSVDGHLKTLETGAFSGCISLEEVTLGDSLESIGDGAFYYCGSLKSLTVPDTVTALGPHAFAGCFSLTALELPDGITSIPDYAFYYDDALETLKLPQNLTSIGSMAFVRCDALRTLEIPASVTDISGYAFVSCSNLETVTLTGTAAQPVYETDENGVLYRADGSTLMLYPAAKEGTSYTVKNGVTAISPYAFSGAASLKEIRLPDSITELGEGAFSGCKSLSQFAFPKGITVIAGTLFAETGLTAFAIPEGVTEIGDYAFYRCTGLTSVRIPDSVTKIGTAAFFHCTGIREMTLSDNVTEIGEHALGFRMDPNASDEQSAVLQEDFLLRGSSKSHARVYANNTDVAFKQTDINRTLVFGIVMGAVLLAAAVLFFLVMRGRRAEAKEAEAARAEAQADAQYSGILEDDGDPYERSDTSTALSGAEREKLEEEAFPND